MAAKKQTKTKDFHKCRFYIKLTFFSYSFSMPVLRGHKTKKRPPLLRKPFAIINKDYIIALQFFR